MSCRSEVEPGSTRCKQCSRMTGQKIVLNKFIFVLFLRTKVFSLLNKIKCEPLDIVKTSTVLTMSLVPFYRIS